MGLPVNVLEAYVVVIWSVGEWSGTCGMALHARGECAATEPEQGRWPLMGVKYFGKQGEVLRWWCSEVARPGSI